ncbi:3-oxo-5-alpha-steroid 4-dehydrogenase 2 [Bagarius yarrelli]|uniref:3-oxo-5-alpha-steroid 4-dehydrogenase 2 n=1 Tax=Bagarius yarrelli TaxID=175774 RepID=A0A556TL38_BAGYA|nr:3-oxo-5-alpha-steroid 4-dehydrogenase 2 [Bagarius yarrelli]
MQCMERSVCFLSWSLIVGGFLYFVRQLKSHTEYGRYTQTDAPRMMVPAKAAWFLQELPSFLVPVFLLLTTDTSHGLGRSIHLWTFCLHYFHRTFIYSPLTKGRPCPLFVMVSAAVFCSLNGFLQGHYMLHCAHYHDTWHTDVRFIMGERIRTYGGMFRWVSGANFFGEILEWCGYTVATWSLPSFAFAFFTVCSIGPRAYHHHKFYLEKFDNYPKSRKAVIPFLF